MATPAVPTTSLTAAARELGEASRAQLGAVLDPFYREAEALGASDVGSGAPKVGAQAPDFTLPSALGGSVTLSESLAAGPVVLVFYRGAWCPYCNLQLNAFKAALGDIEALGGTLVAISPQTPDHSLTFAEQAGLPFAVLSDAANNVARTYGLVYRQGDDSSAVQRELGLDIGVVNGDDSHELPAPAVFVVGGDGAVQFVSVAADYRWRVGPDEVLAALTAA